MDGSADQEGSPSSPPATPSASTSNIKPKVPAKRKKVVSLENEDGSGVAKKKRKQLVACDSCRLRRVKCNKADVGEADCSECCKKGITCTDEYVKNKPKVFRSGKLIQQAKALYGDGHRTEPVIPTSSSVTKEPLNAPSDSKLSPHPEHHLILASEARVINSELTRMISHKLLETFRDTMQKQCPSVSWDRFSTVWDASGRNVDALSPTWSVVAMAMQAWAARFSDHPAIVGVGAPRLSELGTRQDLTQYGIARDSFAVVMLERALKEIDVKGALRKPSGVCAGALVLLEFLVSWEDVYRINGRHLMLASVEHLRCRMDGFSEDPGEIVTQQDRVSGGPLFWCMYTRDALSAAFGGRLPFLTADDISLACGLLDAPVCHDVMQHITSRDPSVLSGLAVVSVFRHLTSIARVVASSVTGPLARRRPLDSLVLQEVWNSVDESTHFGAIWSTSMNAVDWSQAHTKREENWSRDAVTMRAQILHAIHINISDRLDLESRCSASREPTPFSYVDQLQQLKVTSNLRLLRVCREIAQFARDLPPSSIYWACLGFENMRSYLKHMLEIPAWEQGGPENWPVSAKMTEVAWMVESTKTLGWCWPGYRMAVIEAEAALDQLSTFNPSNTLQIYHNNHVSRPASYNPPSQEHFFPISELSEIRQPLPTPPPPSAGQDDSSWQCPLEDRNESYPQGLYDGRQPSINDNPPSLHTGVNNSPFYHQQDPSLATYSWDSETSRS